MSADILTWNCSRLFETQELRNLFDCLTEEIRLGYGAGLNEYIKLMEKTGVGEKFTDLELADRSGRLIRLSEIVENNRLTILDSWASYCGPCRREAKALKPYYEKLKKKGLEIYAVSIDREKKKWLKALEQDQNPWIQVLADEKALKQLYPVRAIPQIFLIGKDGIILHNNIYGQSLINFCETYLQ